MGSIYKRQGSPYYWFKLQLDGKIHRVSTKCKKKSDAEKVAPDLAKELTGETSIEAHFEKMLLALQQIKDHKKEDELRRQYVTRLVRAQKAKVAIAGTWTAWLASPRKRNPGKRTLEGYSGQWKQFTDWLTTTKRDALYLHEITPVIAEEYAGHLWGTAVTPSTYNAHIKTLRLIFRVLKIQAGIEENPWDDLPLMENTKESKRSLKSHELETICLKAKGDMRYWFAIGLYTGLRLGDVVTLKWDEIKFDENMIERAPMKTLRKNKVVRFPLHPVLRFMLEELRETSKSTSFLFPQDAARYKKDSSSIAKKVQTFFVDTCKIQTTEQSTSSHRKMPIVRVGFHSLRHSFVSLCAAHRVPEVAIMEMVGHGSPAMTRLYSHAGDEQKARAIAALPEVSFGEKK